MRVVVWQYMHNNNAYFYNARSHPNNQTDLEHKERISDNLEKELRLTCNNVQSSILLSKVDRFVMLWTRRWVEDEILERVPDTADQCQKSAGFEEIWQARRAQPAFGDTAARASSRHPNPPHDEQSDSSLTDLEDQDLMMDAQQGGVKSLDKPEYDKEELNNVQIQEVSGTQLNDENLDNLSQRQQVPQPKSQPQLQSQTQTSIISYPIVLSLRRRLDQAIRKYEANGVPTIDWFKDEESVLATWPHGEETTTSEIKSQGPLLEHFQNLSQVK